MTTSTRIRIQIQEDSGSILYVDSEDGVVFHIEPMADSAAGEDGAATTELLKSFLRQHLLKNGEASHTTQPLMRAESIGPLVHAFIDLHLRTDAGLGDGPAGANGCGNVDTAMKSIYKTFGTMVSMLKQREKALIAVHEVRKSWNKSVGADEAI